MCSIRTFLFAILFTGVFITPVNSSDLLYPNEYGGDTQAEFKDLSWNRYTTENFVIVSIDDKQGKWLSENIEKIKSLIEGSYNLVEWVDGDTQLSPPAVSARFILKDGIVTWIANKSVGGD